MQKKRRGVYSINRQLVVVPWSKKHPCPPLSEWVLCSSCDARHPAEGHLRILWNERSHRAFLAFIPNDLLDAAKLIADPEWRIR